MVGPADELHGDAVVVATTGPLSTAVEDERVILDRESGRYYGLNPVGARLWELVQEPKHVRTLQKTITMEYDVDAERAERDVRAFLEDLLEAGLVEVTDAPAR